MTVFWQRVAELNKGIHQILSQIWSMEELPDEWDIVVVCLLHRKGVLMLYNNYRGVMVPNIAYKVFSNILFDRLFKHMEEILGNHQCGFQPGRSTVNQIFTIMQIKWKNIRLHHRFIDFQAAYETIQKRK